MRSIMTQSKPRIVVVGAGFGGLELCQCLAHWPVELILVDKNNYHTFQPLLYQVATAGLQPDEIAYATRGIFHEQENTTFRFGYVSEVDKENKKIHLRDGQEISYDYLVLAAGATNNFYGIEGVEEHSFPLKSLTEAIQLRSQIIRQFEQVAKDPTLLEKGALNFVIVGGGATGVELAGAMHELFRLVFAKDFPNVDVSKARIILAEAGNSLLNSFHETSSKHAEEILRSRGVEVMFGAAVTKVTPNEVFLKSGEIIPCRTLVWAAGIRTPPLADALGAELTWGGRVVVKDDLSLPGFPEIFVIGDMAASKPQGSDQLYPQVAPVAIQGGKHVAKQILLHMQEKETQPFVYRDPGIMATIGRNAAVAEAFSLRVKGFLAWLMWLFLHLIMLMGFRNRINVLVNWIWNYFTYDRSARLIFNVHFDEEGLPTTEKHLVEKPQEDEEADGEKSSEEPTGS